MAEAENGNERTRAWVLIQGSPEVAERLYKALGYEGDDNYVVVRADVVEYEYNVVVPVDAANDDQLSIAIGKIQEIEGVGETVVLRVTKHIPVPPHLAHGFITKNEAEVGKVSPESGRLGNSPGGNAWG